ncbi:rna-directed dna polymerase from mobile element jockey- hypothetical protein [Limosa lapponica baueri]|uniref:Rna-directed dna polymerase from mobile element jockey-like n=1 Tax=Limosa lapponica baueri TaxID=1758121 RepID=A0A2I0UTC5_LIMLA|nr:rna-directed dna polymerase from mobile element jockey- hypothetical protein [Limosa lapponica baueri]
MDLVPMWAQRVGKSTFPTLEDGNMPDWEPGTERQMNGKKVIWNNQHGFTKGRSHLNNLIAFYNMVTGLVNKGRTVDGVYLYFSEVFDTVSCNITIDKLSKYRLDKWTVKWIEKWLNNQAQCCSTASLAA